MAAAAELPILVSRDECDRKHRSTRAVTSLLAAALSALVAVVMATAVVGWSARTAVEVREAELKAVNSRLDGIDSRLARLEDKLDALRDRQP